MDDDIDIPAAFVGTPVEHDRGAHVEVWPVPRGSLVALTNMHIDPAEAEDILAVMRHAVGHDEFCLLVIDGGDADVYGHDEAVAEIKTKLGIE